MKGKQAARAAKRRAAEEARRRENEVAEAAELERRMREAERRRQDALAHLVEASPSLSVIDKVMKPIVEREAEVRRVEGIVTDLKAATKAVIEAAVTKAVWAHESNSDEAMFDKNTIDAWLDLRDAGVINGGDWRRRRRLDARLRVVRCRDAVEAAKVGDFFVMGPFATTIKVADNKWTIYVDRYELTWKAVATDADMIEHYSALGFMEAAPAYDGWEQWIEDHRDADYTPRMPVRR